MSAYSSHLHYKGDILYVLTVIDSVGEVENFIFTSQEERDSLEQHYKENGEALGCTGYVATDSYLNCTPTEVNLIGELDS